MPRRRWCGVAALVLGVGLMTAGQARTEEAPATNPQGPAHQTEAVEKTPSVSEKAATKQPATESAPKPARKAKPFKRFRPSEEIHVDKEVDFPSDI